MIYSRGAVSSSELDAALVRRLARGKKNVPQAKEVPAKLGSSAIVWHETMAGWQLGYRFNKHAYEQLRTGGWKTIQRPPHEWQYISLGHIKGRTIHVLPGNPGIVRKLLPGHEIRARNTSTSKKFSILRGKEEIISGTGELMITTDADNYVTEIEFSAPAKIKKWDPELKRQLAAKRMKAEKALRLAVKLDALRYEYQVGEREDLDRLDELYAGLLDDHMNDRDLNQEAVDALAQAVAKDAYMHKGYWRGQINLDTEDYIKAYERVRARLRKKRQELDGAFWFEDDLNAIRKKVFY